MIINVYSQSKGYGKIYYEYSKFNDKELLEIIKFKSLEISKSNSYIFIEKKLKEIENILYLLRSRN